jgi:hypothetical protein
MMNNNVTKQTNNGATASNSNNKNAANGEHKDGSSNVAAHAKRVNKIGAPADNQ